MVCEVATNDPSSTTRPTMASDCNLDAMAGFAGAGLGRLALMCNWKCGNSVEPLAASVGKLLALLKVENANGLRQRVAQLRLKKVLDVVMNVRRLEPSLGDKLRWCEMCPNDDVATGCEASKAGRHSDT